MSKTERKAWLLRQIERDEFFSVVQDDKSSVKCIDGWEWVRCRISTRMECVWTPEGDEADDYTSPDWIAACGLHWSFCDGGPADNDLRYCPGCGAPVKVEEGRVTQAALAQEGE